MCKLSPRLHPGITQEVAPSESQRAPNPTTQERLFTRRCLWRLGSRLGLKRAHNPKVAGSNPAPATMNDEGLADVEAASPFRYPDFTQELVPRNCPAQVASMWLS
jgi:hypothetical protein